ncbi:hypothetical protein F4780DRAFT_720739 [Xylariomycetidae sp. FL0641]|nr:hypothetical protein F4780DRAFT_720739 [Xylariomycetidae sp. FL0641]
MSVLLSISLARSTLVFLAVIQQWVRGGPCEVPLTAYPFPTATLYPGTLARLLSIRGIIIRTPHSSLAQARKAAADIWNECNIASFSHRFPSPPPSA